MSREALKTRDDHPAAGVAKIRGFTLIEVLVALFVLSIGLLGLAALQTIGLKFNQQSYGRTQTTLQAYDIIDRMRANKNNTAAISSEYDNVGFTSSPGTTDCSIVQCNTTQIADYDIRTWQTTNAKLLPQGQGAICRGTFSGSVCTVGGSVYDIAIQWTENDIPMRLDVQTQP